MFSILHNLLCITTTINQVTHFTPLGIIPSADHTTTNKIMTMVIFIDAGSF